MTGFESAATGVLGTGVVAGVGVGDGAGGVTVLRSPAANRSRNGLLAFAGGVDCGDAGSVFVSSECNAVLNRGNTRFKGIRSAEQTVTMLKKSTKMCLMFVASILRITIFFFDAYVEGLLSDLLGAVDKQTTRGLPRYREFFDTFSDAVFDFESKIKGDMYF